MCVCVLKMREREKRREKRQKRQNRASLRCLFIHAVDEQSTPRPPQKNEHD